MGGGKERVGSRARRMERADVRTISQRRSLETLGRSAIFRVLYSEMGLFSVWLEFHVWLE